MVFKHKFGAIMVLKHKFGAIMVLKHKFGAIMVLKHHVIWGSYFLLKDGRNLPS